jgi:hypothetical protein
MLDFATEMRDGSCQVGLAGNGWSAHRGEFPPHWSFAHTQTGREYGTFLRSGRIAIAPVQRELVRHYLPREAELRAMAAAAHTRAVPEYSVSNRAVQVIAHIRAELAARHLPS